jgi:hypothetical protein
MNQMSDLYTWRSAPAHIGEVFPGGAAQMRAHDFHRQQQQRRDRAPRSLSLIAIKNSMTALLPEDAPWDDALILEWWNKHWDEHGGTQIPAGKSGLEFADELAQLAIAYMNSQLKTKSKGGK